MVDLLKDEEPLEYECPECGASFVEGTPECSSCGLRFEWSEEPVYECPECGEEVDRSHTECPSCGSEFTVDENGDVLVEHEEAPAPVSVDELLDLAIDEVRVKVERDWVEMGAPLDETDGQAAPGSEPGDEGQEDEAPERPTKPIPAPIEDVPNNAAPPKLYPGGFTLLGLVFVALGVAALVFSILMARYDTWIQQAAEESMGADQRMAFLAGLVGFTAFTVLAVFDLLRKPRSRT